MKQRRNMKKMLQKYLLVLFSLALVLSPFSSLGEVYAEGDIDVGDNPTTTLEENESGDHSDHSTNQGDSPESDSGTENNDEENDKNQSENGVEDDDEEASNKTDETPDQDSRTEQANQPDEELIEGDNRSTIQAFGTMQAANPTADGFEWELVEHLDVIRITGYTGNDTEITIPSEIDGKEVRYIGGNAFESSQVEKVTVPNTVTSIGVYAFWKSQLKEIHLPDGLTDIRHSAFSQTKLTEIVLPNTLTNIDNYAFQGNDLSEITIPASVRTIGNSAFRMNNLETIHLPSTVRSVGNHAFQSNQITEVTIRNPEMTLGENVFNDNYQNSEDLTIYGYTGSTAETYAQTMGHTFESLNEKVTLVHSLPGLPVQYGTDDADLPLPTSVEVDVEDADGATETITVPISEWTSSDYDGEKLGSYTFTGVLSLDPAIENPNDLKATVSVTVNSYTWEVNSDGVTITGYYGTNPNVIIPNTFDGKNVTVIGEEAFENKDLATVIIPDTVRKIERRAFSSNNLTSITIPQSVETIGERSFFQNNIEELEVPGTVNEIGVNSFWSNAIKTLTIGDGVETISNYAFSGNEITSISIPKSVSSIGRNPFQLNELASITVDDNNNHFKDVDGEGLYTKDGKELVAGTTSGKIVDGTETIRMNAFGGIELTEIVIPESVTSIGREAFIRSNLEKITFKNKDTVINNTALRNFSNIDDLVIYGYTGSTAQAFALGENSYNKALKFAPLEYEWTDDGNEVTITNYVGDETDITIPEEIAGMPVKVIGLEAFYNKNLTKVEIPDGIEVIKSSAFNRNELTSVELPDSVKEIGYSAFVNNRLKSVTLPNGITELGSNSFAQNQIESIEIPKSVTKMENDVFRSNQITEIKIHQNLTEIGSAVFRNNPLEKIVVDPANPNYNGDGNDTGLYSKDGKTLIQGTKSGFIANGTEEIGYGAFYGVGVAGEVMIPDTVKTIQHEAFIYNEITSVEIPDGVETIGSRAFRSNPIKMVVIPSSVNDIGEDAFWQGHTADSNEFIILNPDPNANYADRIFNSNEILYGYTGSAAETYAHNNQNEFITLVDLNGLTTIELTSDKKIAVIDEDATIHATIDIPASLINIASSNVTVKVDDASGKSPEGLNKAGAVLDISFYNGDQLVTFEDYKDNEIFTNDPFVLSLLVNDPANPTIYHEIDEDNWEEIGGTVKNNMITAEVWEFSTYGVFNEPAPPTPVREYRDIEVTKKWKGTPTDSVTVYLVINGERYEEEVAVLNDSNNWSYSFFHIEISSDGIAHDITVEEEAVEGYETSISGSAENGFVITNTEIIDEEDPEDPSKPVDPEIDPCDSQDPIAAGCPEDKVEDDDKDKTTVTIEDDDKTTPKKGTLPSTATNTFNLLLIGGLLLVIGATTAFVIHRRRNIIRE